MKLRRRVAGGAGAIEALRRTWSSYPEEWDRDAGLNKGAATLGEEWGGPAFADLLVELVDPYLGSDIDVLELGCGGGKFSGRLAPKCRSLLCTDISPEMISRTRLMLRERGLDGNVQYSVLNGVDFKGIPDQSVDFIFSYDVQLHLQPENVFSYLLDARRVLRDNGVLMLHQVNLASDGGMDHFLAQFHFGSWQFDLYDARRRGFMYFMSGDQMRALADAARLVVDRIIDDFPPESSGLRYVTRGRDLIGFFRLMPSRLRNVPPTSLRLVRAAGEPTVYAILDGHRVAFASARQFTAAGFRMENVDQLAQADLADFREGEPLAPWE
jgi:2-polyprenyl-3-methyl-5-hydroxy-6-metoxy-1,4-benzoquinol methylase